MASSFWHGDFYFDGVKSTNYKICMVDFNSHEIVKYIGGSHNISIEKDTSYNGQHFYKETERTSDDIIIQLARTDGKPWRVDNILEVTEWLFKENFCKFQPMDFDSQGYNIVYYLKAIDIKKNFTPNMDGFLEITFKSYDGYAYIVPSNSITLSSNSSKTVNNMSNINKKYLPKIKVVGLGNITINNITNGDILTLNGLSNDEQIIIDCAIGSVINSNNENRFALLGKDSYNFIGLNKGKNTIQLTGNATIEFICEYPIIM